MAVVVSKLEFRPFSDRKDWLLPLLGTAAGIAFAAALSTTLRLLRGFAKAREAAFDPPQAILVLGGDKERESLAAKFAASCGERSFTRLVKPESHGASLRLLPVYVSSGHDDVASVMLHAGVHPSRLRIDNRALDTVTNFTSMLGTFLKAQYSHIYVVTSDYHIARAKMIATLVLCSHGIAFTSVVLPSRSKRTGKETKLLTKTESDGRADAASRRTAKKGRRLDSNSDASSSRSSAAQEASSQPETSESSASASSSRTMLPRPSTLTQESVFGSRTSDQDQGTVEEKNIEPEGWLRQQRDRARALLWIATGCHGAELLRFTRPTRYRLHKQKPLHPDVANKED